ncbi:hypothetical protein ACFFJH_11745 [Undibacterium danionis]|uniref:Uncharacterized protein n=1 Tax=Undibacterium danionis TaxID=1812100 RepID=A0ABV6IF82_9BURK
MAQRNATRSLNADNPSGSVKPVACSEWRNDHADSMSARNKIDSTLDAGYTTAGLFLAPKLLINFLYFRGSPYTNG